VTHCSEGSVRTSEKRTSSVFRVMKADVTGTKERVKELSHQRSTLCQATSLGPCVLIVSMGCRCGGCAYGNDFSVWTAGLDVVIWGPVLQVAIFTLVAEAEGGIGSAGVTPQ
jgi:hypothetical protein